MSSRNLVSAGQRGHKGMFKADSPLSEPEKRYCSCLLKSAARQPEDCIIEKAWFEKRSGKRCSNPYAICAKSVGAHVRKCSSNYNFSGMTDDLLRAWILLHGKSISKNSSRNSMLDAIDGWMSEK